jgi:UDP-glucose 4-epimerase
MKIIVTGGAGFIASHVVDAYVTAGHQVFIIDDLSRGSRKNINPKAKFFKANICDAAAMKRIFRSVKPQIVNHHAAFISVAESVNKPEKTFEINVMGTLNVLLAFAEVQQRNKKFIFASTGGAIYGNPKKLPADEHTPPNPLSPYALSKELAEKTIQYFCKDNGIDFTILRYANVFGPRQSGEGGAGVFPIFTSLIAQGKRPTIFGDGKKSRDYVYVGDVARASALALKRGNGETVNIATSIKTTDYQVFKAIADAFGYTEKPIFTPKRPGEIQSISMSYKKAKKILGWEPKVMFAQGVKKLIETL